MTRIAGILLSLLLATGLQNPGPSRTGAAASIITPSVVQSATFSGFGTTTGTYVFGSNVTAGHTIMFTAQWPNKGQTITISDTQGTTFSQEAAVGLDGAVELVYIYEGVLSSSGSETITYTISFPYGGSIELGHAYELKNVGSPFLDSGVGSSDGGGSSPFTLTSSITPGHADDLLFSVWTALNTTFVTQVAAPFSISQNQTNTANPMQNADAFAVTGTTSPISADWTGTTPTASASWATVAIAIKGP